jgi:hypothetical protein
MRAVVALPPELDGEDAPRYRGDRALSVSRMRAWN